VHVGEDTNRSLETAMNDNPDAAAVAQAVRLVFDEGIDAAARQLEGADDPIQVAHGYAGAARAIYRERKDVPKMLALGRQGYDYAIRKAAEIAASAPETSNKLKEMAKTMAFNLAANTWPGWDDPGVVILPEHIDEGLNFAEKSKQLVEELHLGPNRVGTSYWMIGAHHLARRRSDEAHSALQRAKQAYAEAGDNDSVAMIRGYCALADKIDPAKRDEAEAELRRVYDDLNRSGSKGALFYKRQLETADKVFTKSSN
jgi:hypothetical protein